MRCMRHYAKGIAFTYDAKYQYYYWFHLTISAHGASYNNLTTEGRI